MATPTRRSTSSRSSPWPTRSDKKSCHTVVGEGPSSGRDLQDAGSAISKISMRKSRTIVRALTQTDFLLAGNLDSFVSPFG